MLYINTITLFSIPWNIFIRLKWERNKCEKQTNKKRYAMFTVLLMCEKNIHIFEFYSTRE